jgi:hypothetical protein
MNGPYEADLEAQFVRDSVPQVVREAIRTYVPPPAFVLAPKSKLHSSVAFSWGVRLMVADNPKRFGGFAELRTFAARPTRAST